MIMVGEPWLYLITWTKYGGWGWVLMAPRRMLRSGRQMMTVANSLDFTYCPIEEHA